VLRERSDFAAEMVRLVGMACDLQHLKVGK
jgi:hypothetical protein